MTGIDDRDEIIERLYVTETERDAALADVAKLRDGCIDLCSDLANERITPYEAAMRAKQLGEGADTEEAQSDG